MHRGKRCKSGQTNKENDHESNQTKSKSPKRFADDAMQSIDLDREREERIQRNQEILQELGLISTMQSMKSTVVVGAAATKAAAPKRRRGNSCEERTLRRSLRTRGHEPELPPLLLPLFSRPAVERPYGEPGTTLAATKPRGPAAQGGGDAAKFDAHNLHRLRTMSDEAMLKRIHKITNTLKLQSLVQLLRKFGRAGLAEEAQAALDARLANV